MTKTPVAPIASKASASSASGATGTAEAERPSLLLLEDNQTTADALEQLLTHYGYDVHVAGTLLEAMPLLTAVPKFAVLDLLLPDGGGERILELIRRRKLPTRVAVVTACRERDRLNDVIRLKPDCILSKPLDFLKLLDFLRATATVG